MTKQNHSLMERIYVDLSVFEKWDGYNDCASGEFYLSCGDEMTKEEAERIKVFIKMMIMERVSK